MWFVRLLLVLGVVAVVGCGPRETTTNVEQASGQDQIKSSLETVAETGPGGPGSLPTRGSHRPVRAHIRAYGSSSHGFAACR
jgi:hypothetical protein